MTAERIVDDAALSVEVVEHDGSVVVSLAGELDLATSPLLRRAVAQALHPHSCRITLDLGRLTFVDVVGLRAVTDIAGMSVGLGTAFQLQNVTDLTLRVIRLAGFGELEPAISPRRDRADVTGCAGRGHLSGWVVDLGPQKPVGPL